MAAPDKTVVPVEAPSDQPAWLSELSLGVHETIRPNVFLSGADRRFVPTGTTTVKNLASWATVVSPKVAFDLMPLIGNDSFFKTATLAYAPEFSIYTNTTSETNDAHKIVAAVKGASGPFSLSVDEALNIVNGSTFAPSYPGDLLSAYTVVGPRERRSQIQDRSKIALRYDIGSFFIRPVASLCLYDMKTQLLDLPGYLNYESRYDVTGESISVTR